VVFIRRGRSRRVWSGSASAEQITILALSALSFVTLSACGIVGAVSPTNIYRYEDEIACGGPASAYQEKIAAAGAKLGYSVSGRGPATISLQREGSGALTLLVGKVERTDINMSWLRDNRRITVNLSAYGNLGAGSESPVRADFSALKSQIQATC